MSLSYNITDLLTINGANASVNALTTESVATGNYEMAFFGVANFLSGSYTQDTSDVNDIKSTITLSESALSNAHFFYVAETSAYPFGGESDYGGTITQTGLIYGSGAVNSMNARGTNVLLSDSKTFHTDSQLVAMTNIALGSDDTVVAAGQLQQKKSSVGDGLLQTVSAALFKKLGKNAALLNDTALAASLNNKFHGALSDNMSESEKPYITSKFFKRYLESGRYRSDAADVNGTVVSYDLNDTIVNMIVSISGNVVDSDNGPNLQDDTAAITQIFGTSGTDHLIADNGVYSIRAFISLRHDERF